MADSACGAVLNTVELLEHILLRLPITDLLFAQAVCTSWKDIIDTSPKLQRALFFRPAGAIVACQEPVDLQKEKKAYPLPFRRWDLGPDPPKPVPIINPLLLKLFDLGGIAACIVTAEDITAWTARRGSLFIQRRLPVAASKPEASWRRMLLSQPPWPVWYSSSTCMHPETKEYFWWAWRHTLYALRKFETCEIAEDVLKL